MFADKGLIVIESNGIDEEKLMEDALTAGAEDILSEDGVFEIYTSPDDFSAACDSLEQAGYKFASAEQTKIPSNYITLTDEEDITKMNRLLEMLDDNDDVINVWHNWENSEE